MAFLTQKTLQLFYSRSTCTHTPDKFQAVPVAAKYCSPTCQPPTCIVSIASPWQELFAHSWSDTHTRTHTRTPLVPRDPEQSVLESVFEQHPTAQQLQLWFLDHTKPVTFHIPPSSLPPVTLKQPVAASKAALGLESLWESRSNAVP